MPYIDNRNEVLDNGPTTSGELNFIITTEIINYLGKDPRYADYNSVIGVLECCKLELYRRMVAPYEDVKIAENGDVY